MSNINIEYIEIDDYFFAKNGECIAYSGPFGNCQNFCINDFAGLLWVARNTDKDYLVNYLTKVSNKWSRYFLVIDITSSTHEKLTEFIKNNGLDLPFVVETPYINNNNNSMVLCILNLNSLKKKE